MKSLLFQPGQTPFIDPATCGANPCRTEVPVNIYRDGRVYQYILRDKVIPEDAYLPMVKAIAFAIQQGEPYAATPVSRQVRDFLCKTNVVI